MFCMKTFTHSFPSIETFLKETEILNRNFAKPT